MSATSRSDSTGERKPWWQRRRWRGAALAAVLVVAVLVAVVALTRDGEDERAAEATTPAAALTPAAPADPPSEPAPGPAEPAPARPAPGAIDGMPPALPAVALDQSVEQDGVTGSLIAVRSVDGQAAGPGDVAGPAVMVTVRLVNGTARDISLDAVSVNLFHGADRTPGSPLADPRRMPFTGTLPAGAAVEGIAVFTVPSDDRDRIDVEIGYRPGRSVAVFSGSVR